MATRPKGTGSKKTSSKKSTTRKTATKKKTTKKTRSRSTKADPEDLPEEEEGAELAADAETSSEEEIDTPEMETPGLPLDDEEEPPRRASSDDRPDLHITQMQKMTMNELLTMAREEGLEEITGLKKQDLIFKVLKERAKADGVMYGEGVLEVLPDGFGFLRSPRYSYFPCPDDIYVSPSQIRRFGLTTGCIVQGQVGEVR